MGQNNFLTKIFAGCIHWHSSKTTKNCWGSRGQNSTTTPKNDTTMPLNNAIRADYYATTAENYELGL